MPNPPPQNLYQTKSSMYKGLYGTGRCSCVTSASIEKLKMPEIKERLKRCFKKTTGKKADLVARLAEAEGVVPQCLPSCFGCGTSMQINENSHYGGMFWGCPSYTKKKSQKLPRGCANTHRFDYNFVGPRGGRTPPDQSWSPSEMPEKKVAEPAAAGSGHSKKHSLAADGGEDDDGATTTAKRAKPNGIVYTAN